VSSRSKTVFFKLISFTEIVDGYDKQVNSMNRARVLAQRHWEKIRRENNASR